MGIPNADERDVAIELTTKSGDSLLYKMAPKEVNVSKADLCRNCKFLSWKKHPDCSNKLCKNMMLDTTAKYILSEKDNVRAHSELKMKPEFLRCHFYGPASKWYFTGDYNGQCGECGSKKRNFSTGNCVECGHTRKADHKVFPLTMIDGKAHPRITLETGGLDTSEDWEVNYVRDGEHTFIRLTHEGDESMEYKMIGKNQVDLEKVCTEFKTFNNFFSRGMAAGRRPNLVPNGKGRIEVDATGKAPLISCADSRVMAFKTIDRATKFWVKEKKFNLETFLGEKDARVQCTSCNGKERTPQGKRCQTCKRGKGKVSYSEHVKAYTNGLVSQNGRQTKPSMVIFRLAPQDYHRFHYAVSGTIVDHYAVQGKLFSVNPAAINADSYKVFQENQRYVTVIRTANGKMVYAIPVGAAMVGGIVFENDDGTSTVKKGDKIEAGGLHGKMRFGGSTVVYLFEEGVVDYDEDLMARCTGN